MSVVIKRGGESNRDAVLNAGWDELHRDVVAPQVYRRYTYPGVVMSTADPLKIGRVKVRVFELHGDDDIDTDVLPWATPKTQGGFQENGAFSVPPEGSSVWVEFLYGDIEYPIYSAGFHGLLRKKHVHDTGLPHPLIHDAVDDGDPDPCNETPSVFRNYQPAYMRAKKSIDTVAITSAATSVSYCKAEPRNPYHPESAGYLQFVEDGINENVYPKNRGFKTESGIIVETDDVNVRIHIWHPTGTYFEIDKYGQLIIKAAADAHMVFAGDLTTHVKGNRITEVDGDDVVKCVNQIVECTNQYTHATNLQDVRADYIVQTAATRGDLQ